MSEADPADRESANSDSAPGSARARAALSAAIRRLADGDQSALAEIYSATSAKLFGICLRILNDRGEAEDALQDVYVSLLKAAHRFDPARAGPISWLAIFARNRAIDRLRSGKVRQGAVPVEEAGEMQDDAPLADEVMDKAQDAARIHHCIGQLEERQREAVRGAFLGGATYAELAKAKDVPLGTMKSWIRRALAKLKGCLEQ